jgi:ferredoxin
MPKVTFVNENRIVDAGEGDNVRDVALQSGIDINNTEEFRGVNCGGHGLCSSCLCWVEESVPGAAGPRTFMERLRALRGWRRLACRTRLVGDVKVFTMPGQHDRARKQRPVSPPPRPTEDPAAARKPIDAVGTSEFPKGHPSEIASGTRKPPEKVAAKPGDDEKEPADGTDAS